MSDKYVAADVHSATTTFCVRGSRGRILAKATVETNGSELVSYIQSIRGNVHLTFEEGTQAAWLYDLLRPYVAELVVSDPRKNSLIADGNKDDDIDTEKLSDLLRLGSLHPVYHGEHGTRRLKDLVYAHRDAVGDVVRVKNRIKARFRSRGVMVKGQNVYGVRNRKEWLKRLDLPTSRKRVQWLYKELDQIEEIRATTEKAMNQESRRHSACRLLRSAPGIGPIRAAQLVGILDTPHRFRTKRQLWSYSGLSVVTRSSSDYVVTKEGIRKRKRSMTRGLNRHSNRYLKALFKGAALEASRGPWREYYSSRLRSGQKSELVQVTLARKIAAICLAIWKKGEPYNPEIALK